VPLVASSFCWRLSSPKHLGLYIAVLSDEMGWSKTTLSGAAALQSVEAAIIGPVLGWVMDRVGPQKMIRWGMVLFAAGLLLLSQVDSVATFYVSALLMAVGASLGGYFPLSVALVQWFEKFRARALSIMSLGLAMGGLVVPLMAWSIQQWGWRATAAGSGVLVLLTGLPMANIIRRRPEDHGEHVDGIDPAKLRRRRRFGPRSPCTPPVADRIHRGASLRTRAFWMLAIGHGLALLVVSAVNVHAITHMKEGLGYSFTTASWVILIMTFGQLAGVLMGATMGDWFEKRKVAALCMLAHGIGMLCLTYATTWPCWWRSGCSTASLGACAAPSCRPSGPTTLGATRLA
jgi:sugar phosphate permease